MSMGDWRDQLFARDALQLWGGILFLLLALFGMLFLSAFVLVPEMRRRSDLQEQLALAQVQLTAARQEQIEAPFRLQSELEAAQARLNQAANGFLAEDEATVVLNRLYTYAQATGVEIVNLQTATTAATETYTQRNFQFQVAGSLDGLLDFMGSMGEVKLPGFFVDNVALVTEAGESARAGDEARRLLSMAVSIYTSPYSVQGATPRPLENLAELPLPQVQAQLETIWRAGEWERAIRILDQVLVVDPTNESARITLYRAYVNYGYQLLIARTPEAAKLQFTRALEIQPEGREALVELQQIGTDGALAHVVQDQLREALGQATNSGNWREVVRLLRLIEAVDATYGPVQEELFAAYINYGNQLALQGDTSGAEEQYHLARSLLPERELPPLPVLPTAVLTLTQTPQIVALVPAGDLATPTPPTASPPAATPDAVPTSPPSPTPTPTLLPSATPNPTAMPTATPTPTSTPTLIPTPFPTALPLPPTLPTALPLPPTLPTALFTATPTPTLLVVAPQTPLPSTTHVVQPGETLYSIAQRYATSVDVLKRANGLVTDSIRIGQLLLITAFPAPPSGYIVHTVARNETLYSLAQRFGTTVDALVRANNLDGSRIYIGQRLLIPRP
jgi:LysM repeat protein/tetratricopeptide (TPR) repeat protein